MLLLLLFPDLYYVQHDGNVLLSLVVTVQLFVQAYFFVNIFIGVPAWDYYYFIVVCVLISFLTHWNFQGQHNSFKTNLLPSNCTCQCLWYNYVHT